MLTFKLEVGTSTDVKPTTGSRLKVTCLVPHPSPDSGDSGRTHSVYGPRPTGLSPRGMYKYSKTVMTSHNLPSFQVREVRVVPDARDGPQYRVNRNESRKGTSWREWTVDTRDTRMDGGHTGRHSDTLL